MIPPVKRIKWNKTYRIINSCYPPCDVWEDIISDSDDWQLAFELEKMSNPRVRHELGDLSLIPPERVITGSNSWWVISAFTHINPEGDRFTDGTYGAYYAANNFLTSLKEKAYGLTKKFMSATSEPIIDITCRTLVGKIDKELHDIRCKDNWRTCYHEKDYSHSQRLASELRRNQSNGIVYKSIRDAEGECFAAFWPDVVTIPSQERHVVLHWDGKKVTSYCEVKEGSEERVMLT
jgi:hypothetical protein